MTHGAGNRNGQRTTKKIGMTPTASFTGAGAGRTATPPQAAPHGITKITGRQLSRNELQRILTPWLRCQMWAALKEPQRS
eukprot:4148016-Amphidinium_carterae.1